MAGRANALARRGESAPFQASENGPVDVRHDFWRTHARAGTPCHDLLRLAKMLLCSGDHWSAGQAQRRIGENLLWRRRADARRAEIFAGQVEPAEGRVLVEIAQNIGELESAAKMMREALSFRLRHPEGPRRKAPDRARHAIAIKIERGQVGCPYIALDIHLHAIEHGVEILAPQAKRMDRLGETAHPFRHGLRRAPAGIKPADIAPPFGERLHAGVAWPSFVRDIVHGAAEGIDFKHRLAARAWQNAHRRIEGTAARAAAAAAGLAAPNAPLMRRRPASP